MSNEKVEIDFNSNSGDVIEYKYPIALTQQFRFCGNCFRVDTYNMCDFGCKYCFANARGGAYGKNRIDKILKFKIVSDLFKKAFINKNIEYNDINIELLRNRVPLHLGGICDPFMSLEKKYKFTLEFLKITKEFNYPVMISTKNAYLDKEYFDVLDNKIHCFQISILGFDDDYVKEFETNTPLVSERLKFIKLLKDKGFWVSVRIQPLINLEQAQKLIKYLDDNKLCDYITVEHLKIALDNTSILNLFKRKLGNYNLYKRDNNKMSEAVLNYDVKRDNIIYLKKLTSIKIGVGDNDLHDLSDSNCCCGTDCINENFDNYLKYNLTYLVNQDINKIDIDNIFIPNNSVQSSINNNVRVKGYKFKDYVDRYLNTNLNLIPNDRIKDLMSKGVKIQSFL